MSYLKQKEVIYDEQHIDNFMVCMLRKRNASNVHISCQSNSWHDAKIIDKYKKWIVSKKI